jgi:CheY-like chemotaxis protein
MMHLSLLQSNPSLDGETQEGLKELIAQAKRGASLARQLLTFSRRSVLEAKTLDLNQLVGNLLRMLGPLIGEHIELKFAQYHGLPKVEADPGMMEQVLMNLAINARDAMPKGGSLTINLEPVWVHAERMSGKAQASPGQYVILSVADTGCGMDAATQARLFEPFFTTKEVGQGTGLGLATVYGIVTQHKGWIEVESGVGKGTTFRVFLPATTGRTSQPSQTDMAAEVRGSETILLVEDQEPLQKAVARGLRSLGYRVLAANNGQAAMTLWREQAQQIDLLFSDMIMPEGLSGLDLAEEFQKAKPNLKVIISSGYHTDLGDHERPIARRVVYLGKPYEMGSLSKTIRECLDRK